MTDALVIFDRENRDGIVAVGSYLSDAIRRLGIKLPGECSPALDQHQCAVTIVSGSGSLNAVTEFESEHFAAAGRSENSRLACYAKIINPGEIIVMTEEDKTPEPETTEKESKLVEEFEALPLEKKIADLMRMEAVALGETISFVFNSPFMVFEKAIDVLAEFGMKLDREVKDADHPAESKKDGDEVGNESKAEPKKPRARRPRKTAGE